MPYLTGLKRRLNKLETAEYQLDTRLINKYLRTGEEVNRINMAMANRLKGFIDAAMTDGSPIAYEEFIQDQTPPNPPEPDSQMVQQDSDEMVFSIPQENHQGFTTFIRWGSK